MKIGSNEDLKNFLDELSETCKKNKKVEISGLLHQASLNYIASSSEFLGEARGVLTKILAIKIGGLDNDEKKQVRGIVEMIDRAFRKANGLTSR